MSCTACSDTGDQHGRGYLDCAHCDAAGILAIPGSRERMTAAAPIMRALLAEYLEPVLPAGMSHREWKADFDCRVRIVLLRIAGTDAFAQREAA